MLFRLPTVDQQLLTDNCQLAFYPKPGGIHGSWQVFWLVSVGAPSRLPSGVWPRLFIETYSSGDCPGFTPGSLFIPVAHREPKTEAKVVFHH